MCRVSPGGAHPLGDECRWCSWSLNVELNERERGDAGREINPAQPPMFDTDQEKLHWTVALRRLVRDPTMQRKGTDANTGACELRAAAEPCTAGGVDETARPACVRFGAAENDSARWRP